MINENDTYHRTTGIVEKMTWSLAAVLVIVSVLCAYFAS